MTRLMPRTHVVAAGMKRGRGEHGRVAWGLPFNKHEQPICDAGLAAKTWSGESGMANRRSAWGRPEGAGERAERCRVFR